MPRTDSSAPAPAVQGRPRATTEEDITAVAFGLFVRDGFEATTVDAVASAAGISRRTLFRYFPSKNDMVWGEFSAHLRRFRETLADGPPDEAVLPAVRRAVLAFNDWGPDDGGLLRARMSMITTVPALQAHSALRYAEWCDVIAEHVADRLGVAPGHHVPQTVAQAALGVAMAAYRTWVADGGSLLERIDAGFALLGAGLADDALRAAVD